MANKVRRISQIYAGASVRGDIQKMDRCKKVLQTFGMYETIKYKLEKYA